MAACLTGPHVTNMAAEGIAAAERYVIKCTVDLAGMLMGNGLTWAARNTVRVGANIVSMAGALIVTQTPRQPMPALRPAPPSRVNLICPIARPTSSLVDRL